MAVIHFGILPVSPSFGRDLPLPPRQQQQQGAEHQLQDRGDSRRLAARRVASLPHQQQHHDGDQGDTDDPSRQESRARFGWLVREQHQDHRDDGDRADRDTDRQRQQIADYLAHRTPHGQLAADPMLVHRRRCAITL
jgi:hypothetical protein